MNRVILLGRLAGDPTLRTTNSGTAVCSFTVACNRNFTNAQGVREADFINCVAWKEKGELVHRYFTKGSKILVEGSIRTRSYEAQDGTKRYATEVVVQSVEFVDRKQEGGNAAAQGAPPQGEYDEFEEVSEEELPF